MNTDLRLTISELAASLQRTAGIVAPNWKIRRVIDALDDAGVISIQRVGAYRTVGSSDVARIAEELRSKTEALANV